MTRKITTLLLAAAFAAMPTLCLADQVADNGPLPAGDPATVHEAQAQSITAGEIALVAAAAIITTVILVGNAGSATGTH